MSAALHSRTRSMTLIRRLRVGWFPSTATIQGDTPIRTPSGAQTTVWGDVPGLVGLKARVEPVTDTESRLPQYVSAETTTRITLAGVYAGITTAQQVVVSGVNAGTYDITGVSTDADGWLTVIYARFAREGGNL